MNNETIISMLLGTSFRHVLTLFAGFLGTYGFTADQQSAFISHGLALLISLGAFGLSFVLSLISKKNAFLTPPSDVKK